MMEVPVLVGVTVEEGVYRPSGAIIIDREEPVEFGFDPCVRQGYEAAIQCSLRGEMRLADLLEHVIGPVRALRDVHVQGLGLLTLDIAPEAVGDEDGRNDRECQRGQQDRCDDSQCQ